MRELEEDLARRLTKSPNWKWTTGMLALTWSPALSDHLYPRRRYEHHRAFDDCYKHCVPDLCDPATQGCLMALMAQQSKSFSIEKKIINNEEVFWIEKTIDNYQSFMFVGFTLGSALAKAIIHDDCNFFPGW